MKNSSGAIRVKINSNTINSLFLFLTIVITNISQLSYFINNRLSSMICIVIWLIYFLLAVIISNKILRKPVIPLIVTVFVFFFLTTINYIVTGLNYWESAHVYSLLISLFIYMIGCLLSDTINENKWHSIVIAYVMSSCVVAVDIFVNYFLIGFDITSRVYAYDSKNSASQILLTAIILVLFGMNEENKKRFRILNAIIATCLFILISMMKSRATLLGFLVLYIVFIMSKSFKRKYKFIVSSIAILALLIIIINPTLNSLIIDNILFAGRNMSDLNDLSSGRLSIIRYGIDQIHNNLFVGIGNKYLDCYPIATILQFGLLPGIALWLIALIPFLFSFRYIKINKNSNYEMRLTLAVISVVYLLNGLFEALTPLGPGVKCYLLWFVFGLVCNHKQKSITEETI